MNMVSRAHSSFLSLLLVNINCIYFISIDVIGNTLCLSFGGSRVHESFQSSIECWYLKTYSSVKLFWALPPVRKFFLCSIFVGHSQYRQSKAILIKSLNVCLIEHGLSVSELRAVRPLMRIRSIEFDETVREINICLVEDGRFVRCGWYTLHAWARGKD